MSPMSPNVSIFGTLIDVLSVTLAQAALADTATIEFALCGYGSQLPHIAGNAMFATATSFQMGMEGSTPPGSFRADLFSNDIITPDGTYYTATIRDGNGDVLQVNAYRFTANQNADISTITPYDPNQPPPALPPLILNLLLIVPYTSAPDFPGDTYTSWQITLNGDATATFSNLVDGNLYTIIIVQDGSGDHNFTWPLNVYNPTLVNQEPSAMTVQTFVAVSNMLYPIGAGTYWP